MNHVPVNPKKIEKLCRNMSNESEKGYICIDIEPLLPNRFKH